MERNSTGDLYWAINKKLVWHGPLGRGSSETVKVLEARIHQHNAGKGARYTRGRGPVSLVYSEVLENMGEPLRGCLCRFVLIIIISGQSIFRCNEVINE